MFRAKKLKIRKERRRESTKIVAGIRKVDQLVRRGEKRS